MGLRSTINMRRPPRPAHSLLVSPPLHCTGGNGMSLLQCKSRSVPAIFRSGLSMCIRYLASRLCLPKHVRRGGTGSRYLRGLGIGSASGCQWFQTSVHAISLPLEKLEPGIGTRGCALGFGLSEVPSLRPVAPSSGRSSVDVPFAETWRLIQGATLSGGHYAR